MESEEKAREWFNRNSANLDLLREKWKLIERILLRENHDIPLNYDKEPERGQPQEPLNNEVESTDNLPVR